MDEIFYGPGDKRSQFEVVDLEAKAASAGPGTSWRTTPQTLLTIQSGSLVTVVIVGGAAIVYLEFLLVPLILAYFVTFLLAPIMDMMENRPYGAPGVGILCKTKFASLEYWEPDDMKFPLEYYEKKIGFGETDDFVEEEYTMPDGTKKKTGQLIWKYGEEGTTDTLPDGTVKTAISREVIDSRKKMTTEDWEAAKDRANLEGGGKCVADFVATFKVPHGIATLLCLVIIGLIGYGIFWIISSSFAKFGEEEAQAVDAGEPSIAEKLTEMANMQIDDLEASGVKIYREIVCPKKKMGNITVTARQVVDSDDPLGNYVDFEINGVETLKNQMGTFETKTDDCYRKPVFGSNCTQAYYCDIYADLSSFSEFMSSIASVGTILSDLSVTVLLALYILLERPEGRTISGDHIIMAEIEAMVKNYISLKTALSVLTGGLSGMILLFCGVKMAMVFGLLSTLFNYIPNVGSLMAMMLPLPIIILDDSLSTGAFYGALLGPVIVQGYIGNVMEPAVFGASLNLTALSILMGLVFFAAVWGLSGAVISVPLLGAMKICLHHTDHPMAQYTLMMLREDATIP